ncbi:MAG: thioredoxin [Betaproteobacteria bacterium]|nr:thioredoxin [Betaproteobacteria bacterium]
MTTSSPASTTPQLWVYCLCAQWCGTCREYQPLFDRLAADMPQARFVWVDVEEHDALLGDLDIENFPTLLLANAQRQACFAGTVLPHADTLQRMCQAALQGDFPPIKGDQWQSVLMGLQALEIG